MSTLLVDKSAFQALNPEELAASRPLYRLLATDILLIELLGDMRYRDQRTEYLAKKLRSAEVVVNMPYHLICLSELMGEPVPMQGMPVVQGRPVQSASGQIGVLIEPSVGDESLERWAQGEFHEQDVKIARTVVEALRRFDLAYFERSARAAVERDRLPTSIEEITRRVDEALSNPAKDSALLDTFLSYLPLSDDQTRQIRERWKQRPLRLSVHAPFSTRCIRLLLIFFGAVSSGLVGTRNSNFVDIQYLMYLPFCSRFASGDHVHSLLFPFVSSSDQALMLPNQLKVELGTSSR